MTPIIDYRRVGTANGRLPVSVDRRGDAVIITIDLGEVDRQRDREQTSGLIVLLVVFTLLGGFVAAVAAGTAWVALGAVIGGGAAMLLWFIAEKPTRSTVDSMWRFTASPTGLLIEWQEANASAFSQKTYPRERIRDVRGERKPSDDGGDHCEVCIYAHLPHVEPVRYFDLPRRDGAMIVNAIREGLRM